MKLFEFKGKYVTSFSEVFLSFIKNLSGLNFKWQLGYAYESFIEIIPFYKYTSIVVSVILFATLIYGLYLIIKNKNKYGIALLFILLSPLWAIPLVGVEYVVPRYYLYILPTFSLLVSFAVDKLSRIRKIYYIIPAIIIIFWISFMVKYFSFIKSYNYPKGLLSFWSDSPYYYLQKSFMWIEKDVSLNYDTFTVSSDFDFPRENRFNDAQTYYWNHMINPKYKNYNSEKVGHYLMYFAPVRKNSNNYVQIGPYIIERLESNPAKLIDE